MTHCYAWRLLLITAILSIPAPARAQDPPRLTFSAGVGLGSLPTSGNPAFDSLNRERAPLVYGSIEVAMNRSMFIQAEVFSWRESLSATFAGSTRTGPLGTGYTGDVLLDRRDRVTVIAGNFIGRFGARRFYAITGAGAGVGTYRRKHDEEVVGCVPHVVGACSNLSFSYDRRSNSLIVQFLTGIDVVLTPRLTAFANIRATGLENYTTAWIGGARWRLQR